MDISTIISTEYETLDHETPVSKLVGTFEEAAVDGVVVRQDGEYRGVVTRRQLTGSHHPPEEKVGSLVWHVPTLSPRDDVRDVAQAMLDSDARLLPVFEGNSLEGVVTGDDLLEAVREFLDAATVGQAYSTDLLTVDPETTFGSALHQMRERRITHLPVVDGTEAVGILSLKDVTGLATRETAVSSGGAPPGFDSHGGAGSSAGFRSTGGFGAREGERDRLLDVPVRDVMTSPVRTIRPTATLEAALEEMFDVGGSALVVVDGDDRPEGIVTKTDVLRALTWGAEGNRAVQIYGTDLMDDLTYDEVVAIVDGFDERDAGMAVLDAKLHLHEHDEKMRGTPLLLARLRLWTDRGLFVASGEGYGASHAFHEARDVMERQIQDAKTHGQSKKHPDEEYWEKRFGWWLEG